MYYDDGKLVNADSEKAKHFKEFIEYQLELWQYYLTLPHAEELMRDSNRTVTVSGFRASGATTAIIEMFNPQTDIYITHNTLCINKFFYDVGKNLGYSINKTKMVYGTLNKNSIEFFSAKLRGKRFPEYCRVWIDAGQQSLDKNTHIIAKLKDIIGTTAKLQKCNVIFIET